MSIQLPFSHSFSMFHHFLAKNIRKIPGVSLPTSRVSPSLTMACFHIQTQWADHVMHRFDGRIQVVIGLAQGSGTGASAASGKLGPAIDWKLMGKQWRHKEIISGLNKSPPKLGRIPKIHEDWGQPMSLFPTNQNGSYFLPMSCFLLPNKMAGPAMLSTFPSNLVMNSWVQLQEEIAQWSGEKWWNIGKSRWKCWFWPFKSYPKS